MAVEENVGKTVKLEADSLISYRELGVVNTMYTFGDSVCRYTEISDKIVALVNRLDKVWDSPAHTELHNRFQNVFFQVRDMGSALGDVYDMLMKAQQAFYETDDGFSQQLLEALSNTKDGGGAASKKRTGNYTEQAGEPYQPNLIYSPMPSRPVLVSTMGAAYSPDLSYSAMRKKLVFGSCLPSIISYLLVYQSMAVREQVTHNTADAIINVLDSVMLQSKPELTSTLGEAYFPDLSYKALHRKDVLNSIIGAAIMTAVTQALIQGEAKEETITRIGEAMLAQMDGKYPADQKDALIKIIGEAIYNDLYGGGEGSTSGVTGKGLGGITDFTQWSDNMAGIIDDAISNCELTPTLVPVPFPCLRIMTMSDGVQPKVNWLQHIIDRRVNITASAVVTFEGMSGLDAKVAGSIAALVAQNSNAQTMQSMVLDSVQNQLEQKLNPGSLIATMQAASQGSLTIVIGTPVSNASLDSLVNATFSSGSINLEAISEVANGLCERGIVNDFSNVVFPVKVA